MAAVVLLAVNTDVEIFTEARNGYMVIQDGALPGAIFGYEKGRQYSTIKTRNISRLRRVDVEHVIQNLKTVHEATNPT